MDKHFNSRRLLASSSSPLILKAPSWHFQDVRRRLSYFHQIISFSGPCEPQDRKKKVFFPKVVATKRVA
jgi:hypothetical protein